MMNSVLRIPIKTKSHAYEAVIEHGALARAGELIAGVRNIVTANARKVTGTRGMGIPPSPMR